MFFSLNCYLALVSATVNGVWHWHQTRMAQAQGVAVAILAIGSLPAWVWVARVRRWRSRNWNRDAGLVINTCVGAAVKTTQPVPWAVGIGVTWGPTCVGRTRASVCRLGTHSWTVRSVGLVNYNGVHRVSGLNGSSFRVGVLMVHRGLGSGRDVWLLCHSYRFLVVRRSRVLLGRCHHRVDLSNIVIKISQLQIVSIFKMVTTFYVMVITIHKVFLAHHII